MNFVIPFYNVFGHVFIFRRLYWKLYTVISEKLFSYDAKLDII